MNNKNVGKVIIILAIVLGVLVFMLRGYYVDSQIQRVVNDDNGACEHTGEGCPHEEINKINPIIYFSITIIVGLILIGIYLIFPPKVKKVKNKSKFGTILSVLSEEEQKVMKAIKEQDGITQSTLRIRTDLSKTKLSFVLSDLEKKNLIKKVLKGKTNQVFLKRKL
tara:strand:- start:672 stop:1169 length:498 start_codon:yes stop_codon:yes gene_type:complete